jgi:hypothetical protein
VKPSTWLLPVLALLTGLLPVFITPDKKRWKVYMGVILGFVALVTISSNIFDDKATEASHKVEVKAQKDELDEIKAILMKGSGTKNSASAPQAQVTTTINSIRASQAIVANLGPDSSKSLKIEYFPHLKEDVNPDIVLAKLRGLAGSVEEVKGNITLAEMPTNCVWTGNDVTLAEARAVTLTLTAAGVHIRDIRELKDGSGPNARVIQIGSSVKVAKRSVLSPEEITTRPLTLKTDPHYDNP